MKIVYVTSGVVLLGLMAASGGARASDGLVVVPSFVDPQHHIEKPSMDPAQTIRFLTSDDYPPFNFTAPDGSLAGFNIDLAHAVCDELKVTCTIQARGWETLVPALDAHAGDAVVASIAITAKTRETVDFSMPVTRTPARFAGRTGHVPTSVLPETVGSLRIGVQTATAHAAYLAAFFPLANVKTFTDPDSLRAALKVGEIDLMFADGVSTALWLNGTAASGCCTFAGGAFTESRYFGEGSGIAVRKGDAPLRQALDYALERLSQRGVIGDLYLKYFPIGYY
ncbi:transporter substrate-binding domain-containing protein [Lichenihabitans psoromatis]|uniref:transporter substrate-binding domain-containing protein n=1 Tax=Lichenihabitans psoromatis TaxID=2528642 RepID=UPI001FDEB3C9|nr:transporter substrate-binding domain-containing protein [Lichenihabitans psoromatis]